MHRVPGDHLWLGTQGGGPQTWSGCELVKGPCTWGVPLGKALLDTPCSPSAHVPVEARKIEVDSG